MATLIQEAAEARAQSRRLRSEMFDGEVALYCATRECNHLPIAQLRARLGQSTLGKEKK